MVGTLEIRKYGAQMELPSQYIEISNNEMTYIEGGVYYQNYWWGIKSFYTASESRKLQADLWSAAAIGGGAAFFLAPIAIPAAYYGLMASRLGGATTSRGVILNQHWAGTFTVQSR